MCPSTTVPKPARPTTMFTPSAPGQPRGLARPACVIVPIVARLLFRYTTPTYVTTGGRVREDGQTVRVVIEWAQPAWRVRQGRRCDYGPCLTMANWRQTETGCSATGIANSGYNSHECTQ